MAISCVLSDGEFSKYCILIVFGIPATGKSSLVHELVSRACQRWSDGVQCVHMCADDFYPPDLRDVPMSILSEESDAVPNSLEPFKWKVYRKTINSNLERCLALSKSDSLLEDDTEEKWKEYIQKMCGRNNSSDEIKITRDGRFTADHTIIIVDDNLPLRSMRYEYYQMARKAQISFCEAYVTCELETALKWNKERSHPIPSRTLEGMASIIEPPDPSNNHWEQYSIMLSSDLWWEHGDRWNEICGEVYRLCERALKDPVKPLVSQEDILQREASRKITLENLAHQVDQKLRDCVSKALLRYRENGMANRDVAHKAKCLNGIRKTILAEFQNGLVEVKGPAADNSDDAYEDTLFAAIYDRFAAMHSIQ